MPAHARFVRVSLLITLLGAASGVSAQLEPTRESDLHRRLRGIYNAAIAAENARDWAEAERDYRQLVAALPGDWPTRIAMARICVQTNRAAEAVHWLDQAVEIGMIDAKLLDGERGLELLRGRSDYHAMCAKADRYQSETLAIYVPPNLDRSKPLTAVIALHGRGGNEREQVAQWRETADKLGLVILAPRGPRAFRGRCSFGWDDPNALNAVGVIEVDSAAIARAADEALKRAADVGEVDPKRVVVTGFSQGGGTALLLALTDPARYPRVLMVNPTYEAPRDASVWERARDARMRVRIISGELDPLGVNTQIARDALTRAGVEVRITVVSDVGHEPPPDLPQRQVDALQALLR